MENIREDSKLGRLGKGCSLSFREKFKEPNGHTTSNRRRSDVDIMSLSQRPNFDNFPRRFDVLFRCNFADRKIHVVSTYFFRYNFDGRKVHVVSTYFFQCNFFCRNIHGVSTYFSRRNFYGRIINFVCTYFFQRNLDEFDVVVGKL